jgi:hypothetical protein
LPFQLRVLCCELHLFEIFAERFCRVTCFLGESNNSRRGMS